MAAQKAQAAVVRKERAILQRVVRVQATRDQEAVKDHRAEGQVQKDDNLIPIALFLIGRYAAFFIRQTALNISRQ
jgi:hypothetical protein